MRVDGEWFHRSQMATGVAGSGRDVRIDVNGDPAAMIVDFKNYHPDVDPHAVFVRDQAVRHVVLILQQLAFCMPDDHNLSTPTLFHAEAVAGVMISTSNTQNGVAPGASLYSSATCPVGASRGDETLKTSDCLLTLQHLCFAERHGGSRHKHE